MARRALDYLVGFTLSPVLWRKLPGSKSAGRVQSVALRLICDRENEIEKFKPEEYWTVDVDLITKTQALIRSHLITLDGKSSKNSTSTPRLRPWMPKPKSKRRNSMFPTSNAKGQPLSGTAVYHLHPAAGSGQKVKVQREENHAGGAKTV